VRGGVAVVDTSTGSITLDDDNPPDEEGATTAPEEDKDDDDFPLDLFLSNSLEIILDLIGI
jgi:hypothetical protein